MHASNTSNVPNTLNNSGSEFLPAAKVMGIINMAPGSFSALGRCENVTQALRRAEDILEQGGLLIDIGGEPTNPMTDPHTSLEIELSRVVPVIEAIHKRFDIPISIDTSKPEVMKAAVEHGATLINDVRALQMNGALEMAAKLQCRVCLMHMLYPNGCDSESVDPHFHEDVLESIMRFFKQRIQACVNMGIAIDNLIIDPGFGAGAFGKSPDEDISILKNLSYFQEIGLPMLVGLSRKSVLNTIYSRYIPQTPMSVSSQITSESQRCIGSVALATLAVCGGASIIRAHDVKETVEAVAVASAFLHNKN